MKYAIVTGGARGLGMGIVNALLVDKVVEHVAIIDRDLASVPAEIKDLVSLHQGDVTDEKQIAAAFAAITKQLGPNPHALCNNAGGGEANWITQERSTEWMPVELWRRYVDLNLNSVYLVTKEIAPTMKAGSAICNTSSIAGIMAAPELAAYAAAKAAVISYTRSLALQLGPKGIRVNCVAPGLIYTRLWEQLGTAIGGGADQARATFDATVEMLTPLRREQTPDDIGRAVAWLCSDAAINVTGHTIPVDGGIILGRPLLPQSR
jgi:NAD(P)-dependent dehydrogenase (short-subunit alcohol dehydrogenase family)